MKNQEIKVTPEIVEAIENMLSTENENAKNVSKYCADSYLAGSLVGMFSSIKYFESVEEWFKNVVIPKINVDATAEKV